MKLKGNLTKIGTAFAILYSLLVIASATPTFGDLSNAIVLGYYLFIPGYVATLFLREDYTWLERLSLSVIFGLVFVLTVSSLRYVIAGAFPLPFDVTIPVVTIVLVTYNYRTAASRATN